MVNSGDGDYASWAAHPIASSVVSLGGRFRSSCFFSFHDGPPLVGAFLSDVDIDDMKYRCF
jgi:hypothetical protein